ncbi:MAG: hypothetical protein KDD47_25260 [Acidobacteria bacterium]|nr:hypothetical protein [Acidobacteriota bacterium]
MSNPHHDGRAQRPRAPRASALAPYTLATLLLLALSPLPVRGETSGPMVLAVSDSSVSLEGGRSRGLEVGSRLEVYRDALVVAVLEVVYVSQEFASCRIESLFHEIQPGDRVRKTEPRPLAARAEASEPPPIVSTPPAAVLPSAKELEVTQVASDLIYLAGGRNDGLALGDRLDLERDGRKIGEIEVAHLAGRSASCTLVSASAEPRKGDRAVFRERPEAEAEIAEAVPLPREEPASDPQPVPGTAPAPKPLPSLGLGSSKTKPRSRTTSAQAKDPWGKLSGSVSFRWQQTTDASEEGRDFNQTALRLNLRATELGGSPYELRLRVRGREDRRTTFGGPIETVRRDRLYEMAVAYEPPDGKVAFQVGRMRSGPAIGFDYLDGVLAEFKVKPRMGFGAFAGSRSDIDQLGFESVGPAYGAFFHYRNRERGRPFYSELILGAIQEQQDGDISREFLSVYGRQGSGSRWSLYQRADIDINRGWRADLSGSSNQISNLLVSANYRVNKYLRLGVSYDQRRRFRDADNRQTPEELFDDLLRDGYRLTLQIGQPKSWQAFTSFGLRRQPGDTADSTTYNGSIFHSNLAGKNWLLGLDFSGFSGDASQGYRLGLRVRKYLRGGHDLGLTVGRSTTRVEILEADQENEWIRLSGTVRLPRRFFLFGEAEIASGDDFEGERWILQLGYRL